MEQFRYRKSDSFSVFKVNILRFMRPSPNSIYNCDSPKGVQTLFIIVIALKEYVLLQG